MVRLFPCSCDFCLRERFNACINRSYTRGFSHSVMHPLAMREQTARYIAPVTARDAASGLVAVEIVGHRISAGVAEYLVRWEGHDQPTWNDSDHLSCYELIEEFQVITG